MSPPLAWLSTDGKKLLVTRILRTFAYGYLTVVIAIYLARLGLDTIQVGLVFSSDSDLNKLGLVVLQDDKHLENADNVVPIIRTKVATNDAKSILNKVSSNLTTAQLVTLNGQVELQHQDADAVARAYLQQHNYFS